MIYFKKLAQMIMQLENHKSLGQASKLESQAEFHAAALRQNSFSRKSQLLLLMSSNDRIKPIHIMERNLFYFKSTDYKC